MRGRRTPLALALVAAAAAAAACASSRGPAAAGSPSTAPRDTTLERLQRQVTATSIIGDVQAGRTPPMAVGACLDPVASARFELDRSLTFVPDQPPALLGALPLPPLPESLRGSELRTGIVTARLVVDTTGTAIPGSVMITSSPHGLMSAQVCAALLAARFTPARDDGRIVPARIEVPVRFVP